MAKFKFTKNIYSIFLIAIILSAVLVVNYFILAWTEPTAPAPSGSPVLAEEGPWEQAGALAYYDGGPVSIGTSLQSGNFYIWDDWESSMKISSPRHAAIYIDRGSSDNVALTTFTTLGNPVWDMGLKAGTDDFVIENYSQGGAITIKEENNRVGIGTPNPAGDLDVSGELCISGVCIDSWSSVGGSGGGTIQDSYTEAMMLDNWTYGFDYYTWRGQTFTPLTDYEITKVSLKMLQMSPVIGTMVVSIRDTFQGLPIGPDLTSGTFATDTITTNMEGAWYDIDMASPYSLTSGVEYAIVIRLQSQTMGIKLHTDTEGIYSEGQGFVSWDQGNSFDTYGGPPYMDMLFKTWSGAASSSGPSAKTFSGNMVDNYQVVFPHGLDATKIYAVHCTVKDNMSTLYRTQEHHRADEGGIGFRVYFDDTNIIIDDLGWEIQNSDDTYKCLAWYE